MTRIVANATTCECGMRVNSSPAALGRHRDSIFIVSRDEYGALLEQNCLTFAEIGRRLGLSAERVRQLSRQQGITGQQRLFLRRKDKNRLRLHSLPLIKKTAEKCRALGFSFVPLDRRTALINDYRCLIRTCWEAVKNDRKYVRIHATPKMNADYVIFWLRDLAFIFPKDKIPAETFLL